MEDRPQARQQGRDAARNCGEGKRHRRIREARQGARPRRYFARADRRVPATSSALGTSRFQRSTRRSDRSQLFLATAQKAGGIETAISGGICVEIPAGTNQRESFEPSELERISANRFSTTALFRHGEGRRSAGILASLDFGRLSWISTEILQLGPDTVGPHLDHPEVVCLRVTDAGGRSMKAYSRRR